jgi:NAD+ synthase (glutamine-hydrolysing)
MTMRVRLGAAALNQTPLAWDDNKRNILSAIAEARETGVRILCLPELCVTGYGCEDAFHALGVQETAAAVLQEIVPETKDLIVSLGLPLLHKGALFNCAALAVNGEVVGFAAKRFLAGDGLHYEPRWFKAWPPGRRDYLKFNGRETPIGDLVFDCGGLRLGFEICEDAWAAERPGADFCRRGADVLLNPSASHFAFGKFEVRRRFVLEGSRAFGVVYLFANLLGNEAGRVIYDGGSLIASAGRLLAVGPRFSYAPMRLTTAVADVTEARMSRARTVAFQPDLTQHDEAVVSRPFAFPDLDPEFPAPSEANWETSARLKEEEFSRALMLGLFDYLRKSRSHGFVVSLSGGADSSAVTCLAALMVEAACAELSLAGFRKIFDYIPAVQTAADVAACVRALVHCVYQSSQNSSVATRQAAKSVAEGVGAEMSWLEIDAMVTAYVSGAEKMLGRPLSWETDDLALQNIQARVRGPSVWLLANVKNALLLATGNRSEAAVGYATMDGDTCGGLSPIAGIDKAYLRRWLVWLEKEGPQGLRPIRQLTSVNHLAPTAELRPTAATQTDEADLMPYEILDVVERAAIRDKQTPLEVFRLLRRRFPDHSEQNLRAWVERFFKLWCRNQWKRERYAPSFHLDDENLDPKTWCRFPILSGGFVRELEELRRFAEK